VEIVGVDSVEGLAGLAVEVVGEVVPAETGDQINLARLLRRSLP